MRVFVRAGNRRKEQNIVKKSVGFNWGPSAVSTTYWTGFRLSDLLKHCGAKTPLEGARYVHFKGVEKELPQVRHPDVPRVSSYGCCSFRASVCNALSNAASDQASLQRLGACSSHHPKSINWNSQPVFSGSEMCSAYRSVFY